MSAPFRIECNWLHQGGDLERDGLAELSIFVGEECATEIEDRIKNTTRQSARLSTVRLAEWFAANWWRLRWEPEYDWVTPEWQASHKVGAAGGGYVWPDLSFSSDWNTVLVRSCATKPSESEPIRYLREFNGFITASGFERGVDDFVEAAINRLPSNARNETCLPALWEEVSNERKDPELAEWRKLEACLGYDPGEGPTALLEALQKEKLSYGSNAVEELAAASKEQALDHLHLLGEDVRKRGVKVQVCKYDEIQRRLAQLPNRSEMLPWQRATQAAQVTRDVWGLTPGPIGTATLSDLLGVDLSGHVEGERNAASQLRLSAGLCGDDTVDGFRASLNQQHLTARRFALSRLVADYLVESPQGEPLLPATRAKTGRQKFQRAFAQEFLCPLDDLKGFLGTATPGDDDIDGAAAHFEVSPLTVKMTLINKGVLERETLDELAV
jgi:hypothetical protein